MILFFDRNLGKKVPGALSLLGLRIKKHDDYFDDRTTDEEWLERVGREGWCVMTCDIKIRYRHSQKRAIADHGVAFFMLCGAGNLSRWDRVRMIARNWDEIKRLSEMEERPFLYKLYRRGPARREPLPIR